MGNSYSISSENLEAYVDSNPQEVSSFADWMQLQSQIHVEGLSNLYAKLEKTDVTLEDIKRDCAVGLLHDLEKASKLPGVRHWKNPKFESKFKPEFYEELKKPAGERSDAYNAFIQDCSENFTSSRHTVEKVSVDALDALDAGEVNLEQFKGVVDTGVSSYKKAYAEQVKQDWDRAAILYKGKDGKTRQLSFDELQKGGDGIDLTGQQRGFLESCWQQGSFSSGWLNTIQMDIFLDKNKRGDDFLPGGAKKITEVLIDASGDGVKVYNRLEQQRMEVTDDDPRRFPVAEAVLSVDITDLTGAEFVPGCAIAKPKMQFDIQELDESIGLKVPEGLTFSSPQMTTDGRRMKISEEIIEESKIGYAEMMKSKDETIRARGEKNLNRLKIADISEDGERPSLNQLKKIVDQLKEEELPDYKKEIKDKLTSLVDKGFFAQQAYDDAVGLFHKVEKDSGQRKEFTAKAVGSFLSGVRGRIGPERKEGVLDNELLNRMKNGIVSIASHSFVQEGGETDKVAKAAFDSKIGGIIRRSAREEGKAMSWEQFRQSLTERIMDSLSATFSYSQKSKTQKIIDKHPEIVKEIKEHLPKKEASFPRFHGAKKQSEQSR